MTQDNQLFKNRDVNSVFVMTLKVFIYLILNRTGMERVLKWFLGEPLRTLLKQGSH